MKKSFSVVMVILGLTLLSCGGGGGGGGSGSSSNDDLTTDIRDYIRDTSKVYTFQETQTASSGGQILSDTRSKVYSYGQVTTIPDGYGDFSEYPGPYYLEILSIDGVETGNEYKDADGNIIVQADQSTFNRIYDNDNSGEGLPSQVVLGRSYVSTVRKIIFNADLEVGFWGEELGFSVTTMTLKPLAVENVTVPAGTFGALKVQINETSSVTLEGQTSTTVYTGYQWLGVDLGLVKYSVSFPFSTNGVTGQYTITDELASVSDE